MRRALFFGLNRLNLSLPHTFGMIYRVAPQAAHWALPRLATSQTPRLHADLAMSNRLLSSLASVLVVLVAAGAAPTSVQARDLSEYGYYLGVRLKMYDEAEKLLKKLMESGSEADKAKARSALSRVYKSWGEDEFIKTG